MTTTYSGRAALLLALIVPATAPLNSASAGESRVRRDSKFAGKTFVVTGASFGYGRGVAVELGKRHANVVLAGRRTDWLERVAGEVRAAGGTPLVVTADATNGSDMSRLRHAAVRRFGKIDAWVNTVGADEDMTDVNNASGAAIRQFREQRYGTLVNVGTSDSKVPLTYQTEYSEIKTNLLILGRAYNRELRRDGLGRTVKVATVLPQVRNTPRRDFPCSDKVPPPWKLEIETSPRTVDVVIGATVRPREEIPLLFPGPAASYVFHNLSPDFVQIAADQIQDDRDAQECLPARWRRMSAR